MRNFLIISELQLTATKKGLRIVNHSETGA